MLKDILLELGIVKIKSPDEEPYKLNSGKESRLFIDIKQASLDPLVLQTMVEDIMEKIDDLNVKGKLEYPDKFASVAVGGVPITSVISYILEIPQIIVRSEKHDRGTQTKIIGDCKDKNIILIEDVATSGGSLVNAIKSIREEGGICNTCIVVVDREEGAKELCKNNDITLIPLLSKKDFGIRDDIQ